ncbi:MAG: hypothetical protein ACE5GB_08035 [Acidimicrobiales bacterium]
MTVLTDPVGEPAAWHERASARAQRVLARGLLFRVTIVAAMLVVAGFVGVVLGEGQAQLDCGVDEATARLELTGTGQGAAAVLSGVDGGGGATACTRGEVRSALLRDGWFIVGYVALLAGAALALGPAGHRMARLRRRAHIVAGLAVVAGGLDVVENALLYVGVDRDPSMLSERSDWFFVLAATAAWAKFVVVFAVGAYVLAALVGYVLMPAWVIAARSTPPPPPAPRPEERPGPGLALSGGGVRSASFTLGGLQALDHTALGWNRSRRIVSVSGGAYMAGGWALARIPWHRKEPGIEPRESRGDPAAWADPGRAGRRAGTVSAHERHLREHLGYLLEAEGGRPGAVPTILFGLLWNVLTLLVLLWVLVRPFGWLVREVVDPDLAVPYNPSASSAGPELDLPRSQVAPGLLWLAAGGVALTIWVVTSRVARAMGVLSDTLERVHRTWKPAAVFGLAMGVVLSALLVVAPAAMVLVPRELFSLGGAEPGPIAAAISAVAGIGVVGSVLAVLRSRLRAFAPRLGGLLLALIVVLIGGWWATDAAVAGRADDQGGWLVGLTLLVIAMVLTSPEWWSMAPFYRGRLRVAFAGRTDPGAERASWNGADEPLLDELEPGQGRQIRFCGAMQIRDRRLRTHAGIPALSFYMSPSEIAVHKAPGPGDQPRRWACEPSQLARLMHRGESPRLTTMLAVAISGAAVSSAMGRKSLGTTNALLAVANIRLGVWLPHPRWAAMAPPGRARYPRVGLGYLLKEVFGLYDWDDLHVYVTDGGHWENTGIVELLRDGQVLEGMAFDASAVGDDSVVSASEAVTLAALELSDDIDIDLAPLRAGGADTGGPPVAERAATVGLVRGAHGHVALLWYARAVLTADTSTRLLSYAERVEDFPSTSTLDQLFDDEQFQSYRLLGFEAGEAITRGREQLRVAVSSAPDLDSFRSVAAVPGVAWPVAELDSLLVTDEEYLVLREVLGGGEIDLRARRERADDGSRPAHGAPPTGFEPAT